jgi:hypothetical protein
MCMSDHSSVCSVVPGGLVDSVLAMGPNPAENDGF